MALEHLSPQRPACLVDGHRPASQSALAALLRSLDPIALRDKLAEIADDNAFAWDAYSMLGQVGHAVVLSQIKHVVDVAVVPSPLVLGDRYPNVATPAPELRLILNTGGTQLPERYDPGRIFRSKSHAP